MVEELVFTVIKDEIYEHLWDISAQKEDLEYIKKKLSEKVDEAFEEFLQTKNTA